MRKKLSTYQFIEKAIKIHGNKYDYSLVEYKSPKIKIKIICKEHGIFEQRYDVHLRGSNCKKCTDKSNSIKNTMSTSNFVIKANKIHNNFYNYDKVIYVHSNNEVLITCPIHNDFLQKASNHLQGKGCSKCGILSIIKKKQWTLDKFIKKAKEIHKDKYDYSLFEYKGNHQLKIKIICKNHGIFEQSIDTHINQKSGCSTCANMNNGYSRSNFINLSKNNKAVFYIIKCWNEEEEFYKIGITTNSIIRRYSAKKQMPYQFKIIDTIIDEPYKIYNLEKELLKKYKKFKYKPKIKFNGYNECFKFNVINIA